MAMHSILLERLDKAILGQPLDARPQCEDEIHGSINYRRMGLAGWYLRTAREKGSPNAQARKRWLDLLHQHAVDGHLAAAGPVGIASEAGSPGMHWTFNLRPVLGVWLDAIARSDAEVYAACLADVSREVGLCHEFRVNGMVMLPCARVKAVGGDEPQGSDKRQVPWDGLRDDFMQVALGEPRKKASADSLACANLLAKILRTERGAAIRGQLSAACPPRLALPILRWQMAGGGYFAEIPRTSSAERIMGNDGCNWTRATGVRNLRLGVDYGVDWMARPEGLELIGEPEEIGR